MLTTNEQNVLNFIKSEEEDSGWGATLKQICKKLNQTKPQVKGVLGSLSRKNKIEVYEEEGFPTLYCSMI